MAVSRFRVDFSCKKFSHIQPALCLHVLRWRASGGFREWRKASESEWRETKLSTTPLLVSGSRPCVPGRGSVWRRRELG